MKRYSLLLLLSCSYIFGDDSILSSTKNDILNYSYEKSIQDSKKLKNDWVNPITYRYTYNHGEDYDTQKSFISISQPIFKSGGIYYAIKYANSMERYTNSQIDIEREEIIKNIINLTYEIKKLDINIKKQQLLIQNAKLDVTRKKEQVLNGILDTSFLDNAILDLNSKQNVLIDLQYQKESLIEDLKTLSDKSYKDISLPTLNIVPKKQYEEQNIYLQKSSQEIQTKYWMKNMIQSNYFPTINFTADYTKYHDTDGNTRLEDSKNIGFNITIPLDIKYSYNTQSYKLDYLKQKIQLQEQQQLEKSIYNKSISKIKSLDKKIALAKEDIKLYDSLLTQIKEQYDVGMKTKSDLDTIINSKDIKKLDIDTLKIDKQLELLNIYSRIKSNNEKTD